MTFYAIVDVDRTIADNAHRAIGLEKSCKACGAISTHDTTICSTCSSDLLTYTKDSFDAFLDPNKMLLDTPILPAQRVLSSMMKSPMYKVHFITGRKAREHRTITESWLKVHFGFDSNVNHLMMREMVDLDTRASDYKERAFGKLKARLNTEGPFLFFDDDPYIWTMYSKYGLVFKAPECWETLMPKGMNRLAEPLYNR